MRICGTDGSAESSTSGLVLEATDGSHATREEAGDGKECHYVRHDRDQKFCVDFRETRATDGVDGVLLPSRAPHLNAFSCPVFMVLKLPIEGHWSWWRVFLPL